MTAISTLRKARATALCSALPATHPECVVVESLRDDAANDFVQPVDQFPGCELHPAFASALLDGLSIDTGLSHTTETEKGLEVTR